MLFETSNKKMEKNYFDGISANRAAKPFQQFQFRLLQRYTRKGNYG